MDINEGIKDVVKKRYPNARILHATLVTNFKAVHWMFAKAAETYIIQEWEKYITLLDNEDLSIHTYLDNEVGHKK